MSKKHFEHRVDSLEKEAEAKLLRQVQAIYTRYGWDQEKLIEQGSPYELETINKWAWPKIWETIETVLPIIIHPLVMVFIETFVWPFILHINPNDDEESLRLYFDQLYSQSFNPSLWREFIEEIKQAPDVGESGWVTWRIPQEMVEQFKIVNSVIEERKMAVRKKLWEEYKEEVRLLRKEGSIEAAEALEEELKRVGVIK